MENYSSLDRLLSKPVKMCLGDLCSTLINENKKKRKEKKRKLSPTYRPYFTWPYLTISTFFFKFCLNIGQLKKNIYI